MKNMRNTFILMAAAFLGSTAAAQSTFRYDQYFADPSINNLAAINLRETGSLSVFYNRMHSRIPGSPENLAVNLALPVAGRNIGFGLQFAQERIGFSLLQTWNLGYAYTARFGEFARLHMAAGIGLLNQKFDFQQAIYTDPNDPLIDAMMLGTRANRADVRGAALFQYKDFLLGVAGSRLVKPRFDFNYFRYRSNYNLQTITNAMAQYGIGLGSDWKLQPSVLVSLYDFKDPRVQGNLTAHYKNFVWGGLIYTDNRLGGASVGLNLFESIRIGYAYVVPLTNTNAQLGAGHELFTSYSFATGGRELPESAPVSTVILEDGKPVKPPVIAGPSQPTSGVTAKDTTIVRNLEEMERTDRDKDTARLSFPNLPTGEWPKPGHYVVVGTFSQEANADKHIKELYKQGISSYKMFYPPNKYFYVYIRYTTNREEAERIKLEGVTGIPDIWVRTVGPKP
jgi:type IX secretion system PorP/SprF family membrane protein